MLLTVWWIQEHSKVTPSLDTLSKAGVGHAFLNRIMYGRLADIEIGCST